MNKISMKSNTNLTENLWLHFLKRIDFRHIYIMFCRKFVKTNYMMRGKYNENSKRNA